MLDDLQRLIDLQKLDEELVALEEESAGLPGRLAELAQTREAAQRRVAAAKQAGKPVPEPKYKPVIYQAE